MKKYFLFISFLTLSTTSYPVSLRAMFYNLVRPIKSVDSGAESNMEMLYAKTEGSYLYEDSDILRYESVGALRARYPEDDPSSKDRLLRAMLLERHNRSMKVGASLADSCGEEYQTKSYDIDVDSLWKIQPMRDRFWWTIRYCHPYTYVATLGKYALEIAVIVGAVKGFSALKKWYKDEPEVDQDISEHDYSELDQEILEI